MANHITEAFGPVYPKAWSAAVTKYRSKSQHETLTREETKAYSVALTAAILAAQRSALMRETPSIAPRCASGTWHTTGKEIHKAMQQKQRAALLSYPDKVRRERTPEQWAAMYDEAMAEKRRAVQPLQLAA